MFTFFFSGKHDPEIWLSTRQISVPSLRVRLVPTSRVAEFSRGTRKIRVSMFQMLTLGEPWVTRKLFRFRRYAKRMERD